MTESDKGPTSPTIRYPEPSAYNLNKLLLEYRNNRDLRARFAANIDEIMKQYNLTPEQSEAVRTKDSIKLYELSAHPLLVVVYVGTENIKTHK